MSDRQADYPILPIFVERWSPRAFDPRPIDDESLMTLFEAARWSPSAMNLQPWRFVYVKREDPEWAAALGTLMAANQLWAANASALIFFISDTIMYYNGVPMPAHSHSFDTGAAWMALALQAKSMGLITHGMTGVEFEAARTVLNVPETFRIDAVAAVGYPGDKAALPEKFQAREMPSDRRPVAESVFRGPMPADL